MKRYRGILKGDDDKNRKQEILEMYYDDLYTCTTDEFIDKIITGIEDLEKQDKKEDDKEKIVTLLTDKDWNNKDRNELKQLIEEVKK